MLHCTLHCQKREQTDNNGLVFHFQVIYASEMEMKNRFLSTSKYVDFLPSKYALLYKI